MTNHVRTCRISIRRWLVAVALGFFSLTSWASFPATPGAGSGSCTTAPCYVYYGMDWVPATYTLGPHNTALAACNAFAASYTANRGDGYAMSITAAGSTSCTYALTSHGSPVPGGEWSVYRVEVPPSNPSYSCPVNSTLDGTQCVCNSGTVQNGSSCSTTLTGADWARLLNESGIPLVGDGACTITSCYQGHTLRGSGGTCWKDKITGRNSYEIYGPYTATGQTCSMSPTNGGGAPVEPPATPSPATCSGHWGSVNGEDRCIPKSGSTGTGTTTPEDKQTTTTDGTGTTTTGTEGVTSCFDGTCTTTKTTTTTPPGGGTPVTTTTTSTQPKATFCQENPNAPACKAPSECDTNPDSLACLKLGTPDNGVQLSKLDAGFSAITPVSFAAGVGCPADLSFNVNTKPYAISYAPMCTAASTYGAPVVLILGVALAAFIFIGGFKA